MAGMIGQLIDNLNEQESRYADLLGLSLEKRGVIVANDIEGLQKITHLENILISQNQKLEKKRIELTKDIAMVINANESELTVGSLADMLDGQEEQAALRETGSKLKKTVSELTEANGFNASLIDNALDYVEFSLNLIRSAVEQNPAFYSVIGEPIRNEKGIFDARH